MMRTPKEVGINGWTSRQAFAWFTIPILIAALLIIPAERYSRTVPPRPSTGAASQFANILCDQFKPISTSANVQLVTAGNANMFIYICSYNLSNGNAAAQAVSLVEGTGATCASNTVAVVGNSTAANGVTLSAAGGNINYGGGSGAVAKTAVAGDNLCIFTAAGPIGGVLGWTQAPF